MTGPLLPSDPVTFAVVSNLLDTAFASLADELDMFAEENALMSDEIMYLVNKSRTDFATYYAHHIRDGGDWGNAIEVEA